MHLDKVYARYRIIEAQKKAEENSKDPYASLIRTNDNGRTLLEHDAIAAHLQSKFKTLSFNRNIFIYEDGVYRENAGDLEEEIKDIIIRTGAKGSIVKENRDILHFVINSNRSLIYPFNQNRDLIRAKRGYPNRLHDRLDITAATLT